MGREVPYVILRSGGVGVVGGEVRDALGVHMEEGRVQSVKLHEIRL